MALDVDYPALLDNFREHIVPKRSESAAFLIWYMEQYYRLDSTEAIDAVCDQGGDKGVDGIFVNDSAQTITIFQSKISHRANSTVGDGMLRAFLGTLKQFESVESVNHLINTSPNTQVANLIKHSKILEKLGSYDLMGEFVVNLDLDSNGTSFLEQYGETINFVGRFELLSRYISDERDLPKKMPAHFDIFGVSIASHFADQEKVAFIAPVKAHDLVNLDGIEDQSLFAYNVRGPLGNTSVNRELTRSIKDNETHKIFPFFHNGVTIIAKNIIVADDNLIIQDYYVVNGCQSITSLHKNRLHVTDDLRVLTKFIQMDPTSNEAKKITEYSNNQNGVRSRDFKSNDQIHIRLQREFSQNYKSIYSYEIKRGEIAEGGVAISNEEAGLYLMAFDHREPWGTHRKYEVFEDRHTALFARPDVTADRIVLLRIMDEEIVKHLSKLDIKILEGYRLTRYMIMYILREILDDDEAFQLLLDKPEKYTRKLASRENLRRVISTFAAGVIVDINIESVDFGEDFDYRRKLKDADWVKNLTKSIKRDFRKGVLRGKQETFGSLWGNVNVCEESRR